MQNSLLNVSAFERVFLSTNRPFVSLNLLGIYVSCKDYRVDWKSDMTSVVHFQTGGKEYLETPLQVAPPRVRQFVFTQSADQTRLEDSVKEK